MEPVFSSSSDIIQPNALKVIHEKISTVTDLQKGMLSFLIIHDIFYNLGIINSGLIEVALLQKKGIKILKCQDRRVLKTLLKVRKAIENDYKFMAKKQNEFLLQGISIPIETIEAH